MSFRVSIKQLSGDLRKLLSDGLLMRSISSPKLHRLRPASGRDGTRQVIQHQDEDGSWTSLNEGLKLYALPGWDFRGVAALQFSTDVFQAEGRASLNWERWKKQPVLIAGPKGAEEGFRLEDILSYAWSAYGAHFDDDNPKRADSKKGKHWPIWTSSAIGSSGSIIRCSCLLRSDVIFGIRPCSPIIVGTMIGYDCAVIFHAIQRPPRTCPARAIWRYTRR